MKVILAILLGIVLLGGQNVSGLRGYTKFQASDCWDNNIGDCELPVSSAKICGNLCSQLTECMAFVYSENLRRCWLKTKCFERRIMTQSGVRDIYIKNVKGFYVDIAVDCPEHTLQTTIQLLPEYCSKLCKQRSNCVGFVYTDKAHCHLKGRCFVAQNATGRNIYMRKVSGYSLHFTSDCEGNNIQTIENSSPKDCAKNCSASKPECVAFVFNYANVCWLKQECIQFQYRVGFYAYIRSIPRYTVELESDCSGNDIRAIGDATPKLCARKCNREPECVAFVINDDKVCWLKKDCIESTYSPGFTTYLKD